MNEKQLRWFTVALIAFNMVWGMGNVVNNYAQQGISVITSWLLILAIYFIPYALIVGQLGSAFKDSKGGVSSWVENTTSNKRLAYYLCLDILGRAYSILSTKTTSDFDCGWLGSSRKWGYRQYDVCPNGRSDLLDHFLSFLVSINKRLINVKSYRWFSRYSDVRHVIIIHFTCCYCAIHQSNDGICDSKYEPSQNVYS